MYRLVHVLIVVACIALVRAPARDAHAQGFAVNSATDAVDAAPGNGVCETASPGTCTLRAAIQEANATPGDDTITIPPGVYALTIAGVGEDLAATGDLDLTERVTIVGASSTATEINGGDLDVVFDIKSSVIAPHVVRIQHLRITNGNGTSFAGGGVVNHGSAELSSVTIDENEAHGLRGGGGVANIDNGGRLRITDSLVSNNHSDCGGGGILNYNADLEISDSIVQGNTEICAAGGGILNDNGIMSVADSVVRFNSSGALIGGGGISNRGSLSSTLIERSTLHDNEGLDGGGIKHDQGSMTIRASAIARNRAETGQGGGIWSDVGDSVAGDLTIEDSTIAGNSAFAGGGLYLDDAAVQIRTTTIRGNDATDGGGIAAAGSMINMTNSTISGNRATNKGGGIDACYCVMNHVTVAANSAGYGGGVLLTGQAVHNGGVLEARNTLIAGNTADGGLMPNLGCDGDGVFDSLGHNLIQDIYLPPPQVSGCTVTGDTSGNIVGVPAGLGALAGYGGPTFTHVLLGSSPAIDGADSVGCAAADQRGEARPEDGDGSGSAECDIGAYERCDSSDSGTDADNDGITTAGESSMRTDPCVNDTDHDGCADGEEAGANPSQGGSRDALSPYDFFAVPAPTGPATGANGRFIFTPTSVRNKAITLQDVGVVLEYVGRSSVMADYTEDNNADGLADGTQLDRTPSTVAGEPWRSGAPNGAISLQDVGVALAQVGHSCIAPP